MVTTIDLYKLEQEDPDGTIWVELQCDGNVHRVKGIVRDVVKYVKAMISGESQSSFANGSHEITVIDFDEGESLLVDDTPASSDNLVVINPQSEAELEDILELYLDFEPKGQRGQILFICHFFSEKLGKKDVTQDDIRKAYDVLADIPVSLPRNLPARIRECVDEGFLRTFGDNDYLTLPRFDGHRICLSG